MKTSILKLGKALNKAEQKEVNGGNIVALCDYQGNCPPRSTCQGYVCIQDTSGGNSGGSGGGDDDNCTPNRFCVNEYDTCCIG